MGPFIFENFYGALRSPSAASSSPICPFAARSFSRAKIAHFTQSSFFKTAIAVLRSPPPPKPKQKDDEERASERAGALCLTTRKKLIS